MALPVFIYRRRFGGDKIQVNFVAFFCCAAHNISRLDSRENAVYSSDLCGEPEAQAEVSALVFFKRVFGIGANVRSYGEFAGMAQFYFGGFGLGYSY